MDVIFEKSVANGKMTAPASKSFLHRALILGAFSDKSRIENVTYSEDVLATADCLKKLGADVLTGEDFIEIGGLNVQKTAENTELFCNESASTLRFLIPVCLLFGKKIKLFGTEKLFSRPLDEYEKIFENQNFLFEKTKNSITVCGLIKSGEFTVCAEISSQFVTGLLLALSLVDGKSVIKISGETESAPYIDITLNTLNQFGIKTEKNGNIITVFGSKKIKDTVFVCEKDATNSAYLEAFSFLDGNLSVKGADINTVQGDTIYKKMFSDLKNGKKAFDLRNCPDLAPLMFCVSCFTGTAEFKGINRLKFKESDRILSMKEELKKFGVSVIEENGKVIINPENIKAPNKDLSGHNDHRVVMALSLLSAKYGGKIKGAEAVNKSFPDFFKNLEKSGIKFTYKT